MKSTYTSPGFPRVHPDNLICVSFIVAPKGYSVVVDFEEFNLEDEPQCRYDYLKLFEYTALEKELEFKNSRFFDSYDSKIEKSVIEERHKADDKINYQLLLNFYTSKIKFDSSSNFIFQPSNETYNSFVPPPSNLEKRTPRIICGDWSSKLKLLRYKTDSNLLGIHYEFDYSHHFTGFKAKLSLQKGKYH